jgi:hypothetical protein
MKAIARSLVVVLVALIAVPALVVSTAITCAVQLLATTALIMGGTDHPLSPTGDTDDFVNNYFAQAVNNFIAPGLTVPAESVDTYAVTYPAEFFPAFGTTTFEDSVAGGRQNLGQCLDNTANNCGYNNDPDVDSPAGEPPLPGPNEHFIVFGYSQSAVVASLVKNDLINDPTPDQNLDGTEFVLVSNPMRPNGGILGRGFEGQTIPIIGIPFYGPTQNSCPTADPCSPAEEDDLVFPTVDVAQQYDFLGGDAPARLDPLAFANSIAAYSLLHGLMPNRSIAPGGTDPNDPYVIYQDTYGDTTYYMVTAPRLPLLMLIEQAGVPGPVLALPDALLRVWIEDKYRRDLSPGEHVPFELSPIGNPINLVGNMLGAIPVGIDDTVQQATGAGSTLRPLGTANVYRPFGVGGQAYNKTTGQPVDDNIGLPTGAGDYDDPNALQTAAAPEGGDTNKLTVGPDADDLGNDNNLPKAGTPKAIKPSLPFEKWREGLKADPDHKPFGIRPGEGPVSRVVKALTGQRQESDSQKPAANESEGQDAA